MKRIASPLAAVTAAVYYSSYYWCFFLTTTSSPSIAWRHDPYYSPPAAAFLITTATSRSSRTTRHLSADPLSFRSPLQKSPPQSRRWLWSTTTTSIFSSSPLDDGATTSGMTSTARESDNDNDDDEQDINSNRKKNNIENNKQKVIITTDTPIVTPSSVLDQNLTNDERSIVNIVRTRSPSVACVSSYSIPTTGNGRSSSSSSRQRYRENNRNINKKQSKESNSKNKTKEPPVGSVSLGSGSAFAISHDGYLITNYHVIERAYQIQQTSIRFQEFQNNITRAVQESPLLRFLSPPSLATTTLSLPRSAQVYASLKSSSEINIPCRIVHVLPERDIAILHLNSTSMDQQNIACPPPIPNGLSTDLLVGQTVLAIGNPFGLSQTVTTGVVSSLDRTVKGVAGNDIRGCIQTDAAINPGNSGGPLLNSMGQVVGVNTMIVSTSGSNAGIGFAVPLDGIWSDLMDVVEKDREDSRNGMKKKKRGWLGVKVVTDDKLQDALFQRIRVENDAIRQGKVEISSGVFVLEVESGSPALDAGIRPLEIKGGKVDIGDRVVAVNGNRIDTPNDLKKEIQVRVVGEKVALTVEDKKGERRVVYTTMMEKS